MVEANPNVEPPAEELVDIEQELFEVIDNEIRATQDWCKDLVQELAERHENLARRHLAIVKNKLILIQSARSDFIRMGHQ